MTTMPNGSATGGSDQATALARLRVDLQGALHELGFEWVVQALGLADAVRELDALVNELPACWAAQESLKNELKMINAGIAAREAEVVWNDGNGLEGKNEEMRDAGKLVRLKGDDVYQSFLDGRADVESRYENAQNEVRKVEIRRTVALEKLRLRRTFIELLAGRD